MLTSSPLSGEPRWAALSALLDEHHLGALLVFGVPLVGSYGTFSYLTGALPAPKGSVAVLPAGGCPVIVCGSGDVTWEDTARFPGVTVLEAASVVDEAMDLAKNVR